MGHALLRSRALPCAPGHSPALSGSLRALRRSQAFSCALRRSQALSCALRRSPAPSCAPRRSQAPSCALRRSPPRDSVSENQFWRKFPQKSKNAKYPPTLVSNEIFRKLPSYFVIPVGVSGPRTPISKFWKRRNRPREALRLQFGMRDPR